MLQDRCAEDSGEAGSDEGLKKLNDEEEDTWSDVEVLGPDETEADDVLCSPFVFVVVS